MPLFLLALFGCNPEVSCHKAREDDLDCEVRKEYKKPEMASVIPNDSYVTVDEGETQQTKYKPHTPGKLDFFNTY